jgi:diguanylate cyclase
MIKYLTSHIIEMRTLFMAGEEDPRETLGEIRKVFSERDPKKLRDEVDGARRLLRDLMWNSRQVRETEKTQLREIGGLVSDTLKQLQGSDDKLTGKAADQFDRLDDVLTGKSETSPRVALAVAVRHLRQAFKEHSDERDKQNRKMDALVTTLQAELQTAQEKGARDPLTGLYNRGSFDEEIKTVCARSAVGFEGFGLLMIDIDHFKSVNDNYGHPVGDQVLKHVANLMIKTCLRKDDFVARYGGEEFSVILRDVSETGLERTGERLRKAIEDSPAPLKDKELPITVSIGAGVATPEDSVLTLIERVDSCLYRAKETGRNRVVLAETPSSDSSE